MKRMLRAWAHVCAMAWAAWPVGALSEVLLAIVFGLFEGPAVAIALRGIVDGLAVGGRGVLGWAVAAIVALVGMQAVHSLNGRVLDMMGLLVPQEVNRRLMRGSLAQAGVDHLEDPAYADRVELLQSQSDLPSTVFGNLAALASSAITVGVGLIMLGRVHLMLIAALAPVVPIGVLHLRAKRRLVDGSEQVAPDVRLSRQLVEIAVGVEGAKEVRMFGTHDYLLGEHRRLRRSAARRMMRAGVPETAASIGMQLVSTAALVAGIALLARLATVGRATPGDVVMGVALLRSSASEAGSLWMRIARCVEQGLVAQRYLSLLEHRSRVALREEPVAPPTQLRDGIRFERVSFAYAPSRLTLANVSFHLRAGSTVALVGDNGAGKTTIVKLLCRLYDPDGGVITVDGTDLRAFDLESWRRGLTAAFQDGLRAPFTATETVGIGDLHSLADQYRLREAAALGGALGMIERLPSGWATPLGRDLRNGIEPSAGQWQALALARASMRRAPLVLVLDEPTAALDAAAEHALFERFRAASAAARQRGAITVLVSHRFSTVQMADHIVVLDQGTVAEAGSHEELMAHAGFYASMYAAHASAYRRNG